MRPIRLTFAGLRSYRSEAVIDFANLDLFAIVGDTGAGKSTIIEALSLALYAVKTWKGGSSKTDMIAEGESTLRIELVFAADGRTWTVSRSWKRTGSPISRLVSDDGEKVDGSGPVTRRIEELLGLDHAQFTRAVVMPQGRFDELLRAGATERSKLLASILGLDAVRRTGEAARTLRDRWNEPLALARDRRSHLPGDPASAVADATRVEVEVRERFAALQGAVAVVDARARDLTDLTRSIGTIDSAQRSVPPLQGDPVADLDAADRLGQELATRHRSLTEQRKDLDATVSRLDEETTKLLGGFPARDAAVRARSHVETAGSHLGRDIDELATAHARLAEVIDGAPTADPDPALVAAVDAARAAVVDARQGQQQAEVAQHQAVARWRDVVAARAELERGDEIATAAAASLVEAERVARAVADTNGAAIEALAEARDALDAARRADAAAVAGAACAPGDDCPVCRQTLPPTYQPPTAGAIDDALALVHEAEATLDAARTASSVATGEATAAGRERARADQHRIEAARRVEEAEADARAAGCVLAEPSSATSGDASATADAATEPLSQAVARATAALVAAEDQRRVADAALAREAEAIAVARARHDAELEAARAAATTIERRVAEHAGVARDLPEGWRPTGPVTVEVLAALVADLDEMLAALAATDGERTQATTTRAEVVADLDAVARQAEREVTLVAERALGTLNARFDRVRGLIDALASVAGIDERVAALGPPPQPPAVLPSSAKASELAELVEVARAGVDRSMEAEATATSVVASLSASRDALDGERAAALAGVGCPTVDDLRGEHGATQERLGTAAERVASARADQARADDLDRFTAAAEPFVANLSVLAEALRDKQFVGHLVKARELQLIAEANRRLRSITQDRFGFVGDFGVVSVASGEIRSPDALSGGERFQAALALALALVEIASRGRGRLEAVFVDEGFGSLDLRSLDAALATLGEVAGGGKMVGLISHLKPVAEAVETVLLVQKDDLFGSTIRQLDAEGREHLLADDIRSGLTGS